MSPSDKKPIPYISPEILSRDGYLEETVYPNPYVNYYWSDRWEADFYIDLARAGFISVAMDHEQMGPILMAEIQYDYALLNWENLHVSRKVKKLINRNGVESGGWELAFCDDPGNVIRAVREQFGSECWLTAEYESLIYQLSTMSDAESASKHFRFHTIELRDKGVLTAGELGYTCGRIYTSLTGFSSRKTEHNNHGTLQMALLANRLRESGYAFWNMGHPFMDYKFMLGAEAVNRDDFINRWSEYI